MSVRLIWFKFVYAANYSSLKRPIPSAYCARALADGFLRQTFVVCPMTNFLCTIIDS